MWTIFRPAASGALRVVGAAGALPVARVASRAALNRATAPRGFRINGQIRSFAEEATKTKTKKTATKKKTATGGGAAKAKAKKDAPKKKKKTTKAAAKPAKKKKVAKKPTPEEARRLKIRELKLTGMVRDRPIRTAQQPWALFVEQQTKGESKGTSVVGDKDGMGALSQKYRSMSTSEHETLRARCEDNKLANAAAYKSWVELNTPAAVVRANNARALLNKLLGSRKYKAIKDERLPKHPITAFAYYNKARWASGDLNGMSVGDASKQVGQEWRGMTKAQQEPYYNLAESSIQHYEQEVAEVLGREVRRKASPAA